MRGATAGRKRGLKNPSATAQAFKGGWFHTGDLAVMESDHYVKIKDRSKDIIISGGENISSLEVEDALYRHPAVVTCAIVAKPDDKWGEAPREIRFEAIPKTATGKIQKFALRERAKPATERHS